MNNQKFVDAIFSELFEDNFPQYKESLLQSPNNNSDLYGLARNALASISDEKKIDIINFMKVVMTDTVSLVFGTLDGVHFPGEFEGDFVLNLDGEEIQGDLQDLFLGKVEMNNLLD